MKPKNKNVVKAWVLVDSVGNLQSCFSSIHSVFMPRIYSTKLGAEKVADVIITGAKKLKVVPITITLPKQKR